MNVVLSILFSILDGSILFRFVFDFVTNVTGVLASLNTITASSRYKNSSVVPKSEERNTKGTIESSNQKLRAKELRKGSQGGKISKARPLAHAISHL